MGGSLPPIGGVDHTIAYRPFASPNFSTRMGMSASNAGCVSDFFKKNPVFSPFSPPKTTLVHSVCASCVLNRKMDAHELSR